MKRTTWTTGTLGMALALMLSAGTITAFAAETEAEVPAETGSYSYLTGRQRSISRNEIYAQAELIEDEAEREAFLHENGIAETEYSVEAAADYSYVSGRERGAGYRSSDDAEGSEAQAGYSYLIGQQRGSSYHQ